MQLKKIKLIEDIERYTSAFGFLLSTIISVLHSFYMQFLLKCNSLSWNSRAVVPEPQELARVPRGVVVPPVGQALNISISGNLLTPVEQKWRIHILHIIGDANVDSM